MEGWISLHRKLFYNFLWEDKPFSKGHAWVDLLLLVNYQDKEVLIDGKIEIVKKGQKITSIRTLSERWGWSRDKVSSFLNLLEKEKMLAKKTDKKKTVLTITRYEFYQLDQTIKRHQSDTEKTLTDTNNNINNINKYIYTLKAKKFEKLENQEVDSEADIVLEEKYLNQLKAKCTSLLRKDEFVNEVMEEYYNDAFGKFRTSAEHTSRIMKFMQNKHLGVFDPKKQVKNHTKPEFKPRVNLTPVELELKQIMEANSRKARERLNNATNS